MKTGRNQRIALAAVLVTALIGGAAAARERDGRTLGFTGLSSSVYRERRGSIGGTRRSVTPARRSTTGRSVSRPAVSTASRSRRLRVMPLRHERPSLADTNTVIRVPADRLRRSRYGYCFTKDGWRYCPSARHSSWWGGYPYRGLPLGCRWDRDRGRYICYYDYFPTGYFRSMCWGSPWYGSSCACSRGSSWSRGRSGVYISLSYEGKHGGISVNLGSPAQTGTRAETRYEVLTPLASGGADADGDHE